MPGEISDSFESEQRNSLQFQSRNSVKSLKKADSIQEII
jgi:hypothetical protein